MSETSTARKPTGLAIALIVTAIIGLIAAFVLTVEKIHLLTNPGDTLSCDFGLVVQCGANLASWQGSVFGFPNPLLGLIGWTVVLTTGVSLLANAHFPRWYWIGLNIGLAGALAFVIWLIGQSIFILGTLCPWCMVTWAVTIPAFLTVTLYNLKEGTIPFPAVIRRIAVGAYSWIPLITLGCYLVIAVIAQLQLDVLSYL